MPAKRPIVGAVAPMILFDAVPVHARGIVVMNGNRSLVLLDFG